MDIYKKNKTSAGLEEEFELLHIDKLSTGQCQIRLDNNDGNAVSGTLCS
jgi:hypothetical protein